MLKLAIPAKGQKGVRPEWPLVKPSIIARTVFPIAAAVRDFYESPSSINPPSANRKSAWTWRRTSRQEVLGLTSCQRKHSKVSRREKPRSRLLGPSSSEESQAGGRKSCRGCRGCWSCAVPFDGAMAALSREHPRPLLVLQHGIDTHDKIEAPSVTT